MMDSTSQERGGIETLNARWLAAERRQDVEALFRSFFAGFSFDHDATIKEIQAFDSWAYAWGSETMLLTSRSGGPPIRLRGFGFSILRRGADGVWRFARGINNLAPEMPVPVRPNS